MAFERPSIMAVMSDTDVGEWVFVSVATVAAGGGWRGGVQGVEALP